MEKLTELLQEIEQDFEDAQALAIANKQENAFITRYKAKDKQFKEYLRSY